MKWFIPTIPGHTRVANDNIEYSLPEFPLLFTVMAARLQFIGITSQFQPKILLIG